MAYTFSFSIALGEDDTGLTLRGQLTDSAGADVGGTFTAGFVEVGAGVYGLTTSIPDAHRGFVVVMNNADGIKLAQGVINPEQGEQVAALEGRLTEARAEGLDHIPKLLGRHYYVCGTTGNDGYSGLYPDQAFATIGRALAVAVDGDNIIVAAGLYAENTLEITQGGLLLTGQRGAIIKSSTSPCLTVTGNHVALRDIEVEPQTPNQIGIVLDGDHAELADCLANGTTVGFDVNGEHCHIQGCRTVGHGTTGFDISGPGNTLLRCHAGGDNSPTRGFYLSAASADCTAMLHCSAVGNATASFEIVGGVDNTALVFCGGGSAVVDGGSDTVLAGYAIEALPTAAEIDTQLSGTHGDGLWVGTAGSGARTVPFAFSNGAGVVAGSLKVHVEDGNGNLAAGPLTTDTLGVVTFYLDDGDYSVVSASTIVWQGNEEAVTIDADSEDGVAVTLTAQVLPTPSSPDKYTIIINAADEFGDLVGAAEWSIAIADVSPRGLSTATLVQLTQRTPIVVGATGQAAFEVATATETFVLEATPTLADGTTGEVERFACTVRATDANDDGQIYLSAMIVD